MDDQDAVRLLAEIRDDLSTVRLLVTIVFTVWLIAVVLGALVLIFAYA
jgi:hypothetical protein